MKNKNIAGVPHKKQIVVIIAALLFTGFIAICIISYLTTSERYKKSLSDNILPLTGDNIYSEVRKDIIELTLISSFMANDTFLIDWTLDGEKDEMQITKYLKTIQKKYNTIISFFASEKSGNYYLPGGLFTRIDPANSRDDWYFETRDSPDNYQINIGIDDTNNGVLTIFINYKIFDYNNDFMGITGCGLTVKTVQELLDDYALKYNRIIYFIDNQKDVFLSNNIVPPPFKNLIEIPELDALNLHNYIDNPTSLSYRINKREYLVNIRYIPELDLFLFVEQAVNQTQQRNEQILLFLKIFGISLPIGIIICILIILSTNFYQRQLEIMATTDPLTGLNNRNSFDILLSQAFKESLRGIHLTMLLYDIDHFKNVNDTYGHSAGDAVLKNIADTTREFLREADAICRWGGEEFLILLHDCTKEDGFIIAEEIRKSIHSTATLYGKDSINVTISIGIAEWDKNEKKRELFSRVDKALYRAKEKGRNRVEIN